MIRTRNLHKGFDAGTVVSDVSLAVDARELAVVLGPSGCGKTTLLRLIAGLERPDAGEIEIDGREVSGAGRLIPPHQRGLGMIFQDLALWPHMQALGNVTFGLGKELDGHARREERALEVLHWVGLDGHRARYPHQLSGGERQRLAIARSLAPGHPCLLMDEPFSSLDPLLKQDMIGLLRRVKGARGLTVLYVTHNLDEALALADRIFMMKEGRLVGQLGPGSLKDLTQDALLTWYEEKYLA